MRANALAAVLFALVAATVVAQVPTDPVVLRQRLDDKLAAPFLRCAPWHTSLDLAKRAAARDGKLILVHCTRSFIPCGTSIRCEHEVLSTPEFATLAGRVVLCCHVTAHLDEAADRLLLELRGSGWPHHALLDATGRVLGTHESWREKSVAELSQLVDRGLQYLQVEADTELAIAAANRRRLQAGLEAGALDLGLARQLFAASGPLPREQRERWSGMLTDLEVAAIASRFDRFDEKVRPAAGAEFYGLWRMGKRPAARNAARDFWGGILLHIETQAKPDLELYRDALGKLQALFAEARSYEPFLQQRQKALAELEQKAAAAPAPGTAH